MTDDVKRYGFLLRQKPICTQSPIKTHLGAERHRELRAKYKLELGIDLLDDRCDNVFNCKIANQGCIGRPFPKDPEIHKVLQRLNGNIYEGVHKGIDVYFFEGIVECHKCPFREGCEVSCPTQDSYLRRNTKPESNPPENSLVPYDDFEKGIYKALDSNVVKHCSYGDWMDEDLPLDCLTFRQQQVVAHVLYDSMEYKEIADELGISFQSVGKHLTRAKERLKEFGRARKAISEGVPASQRVLDYYVNNLTQKEIARKYNIDQGNLSRDLTDWYNSNIHN